jgi:uncharacterized protein YceK
MRLVAVSLLAAVALTGCGAATTKTSAGKFKGTQKQVAQAIDDFSKTGKARDAKKACTELLATKIKQGLQAEGKNCISTVQKAFDDADSDDLSVQSISVAGTTATARVKYRQGTHDVLDTIALANEQGRWKIASFGGGSPQPS